jgi:hypothetical protein
MNACSVSARDEARIENQFPILKKHWIWSSNTTECIPDSFPTPI